MKAVKVLALILFGLLALVTVPGAADAQRPPVVTTETELPKEALPLKIIYNYERGNIDAEVGSNGVSQDELRGDLGELKGVTVGGTFIPADGKAKDVEIEVNAPDEEKLRIRIRLSVTVWGDRDGNIYVHIRLSVSIQW